jgi:CRP-like cAMP-binding protein
MTLPYRPSSCVGRDSSPEHSVRTGASTYASELTEAHYGNGIKDPNGIRLTVLMTRQGMANMVGVTTESAIRVMSRLKRDRLVSGTAKRLIILELPLLKKFASL